MSHKMELQARALVLHLGAEQSTSSRRMAFQLIEAGYGTVQKLRDVTDEELLEVPGIGPVAIGLIRELLAALGG